MSKASKALQQFCDRQMGLDYPHGHWDKDRVYFVLEEILPCCTPEIRADSHVHMDHARGKEHLAVKWGTTADEIDQELFSRVPPLSARVPGKHRVSEGEDDGKR